MEENLIPYITGLGLDKKKAIIPDRRENTCQEVNIIIDIVGEILPKVSCQVFHPDRYKSKKAIKPDRRENTCQDVFIIIFIINNKKEKNIIII